MRESFVKTVDRIGTAYIIGLTKEVKKYGNRGGMKMWCSREALRAAAGIGIGLALACAFVCGTALAAEVGKPASADTVSGASFSIYQKKTLRLHVITLSENEEIMNLLDETIEHLRKAFAPYPIDVERRVPSDRLEDEIRTGEIDVFIASSGYFQRMAKYGAISSATVITPHQPDPNNAVGSTFLVRRDNRDIFMIEQMANKRLTASYKTAFMSYRTGMAEIAAQGYDPEDFFSSIRYLGDTFNEGIVAPLDRGEADVALVHACWLENQPEEVQKKYRVIGKKTDTLNCLHSSDTYPNIMVGVTAGAAPGAAHIITKTLLEMPPATKGGHWGVATDMRKIDTLYRLLKIENYAYLRHLSIERFLEENRGKLMLGIGFIVLLLLHSWRVSVLVDRRTRELRTTIAEREKARRDNDNIRERMSKLQESTILAQLSNLIAHELTQPLSVIQYYSDGLGTILNKPTPNVPLMKQSLEGVKESLTQIRAIVDRVRHYSKGEVRRDDAVEVRRTVEIVTAGLAMNLRDTVKFTCEVAPEDRVEADRLEFELLINNMLKNAFEAAVDSKEPYVALKGGKEDVDGMASYVIRIENSGVVLDEHTFTHITVPLVSTKRTGNGLGVPIAIALAEASGGHVDYARREGGGLIATIVLKTAGENA